MKLFKIKKLKFSNLSLKSLISKFLENLKTIVILVMFIIILATIGFLYNYFYLTMISARQIEILNNEIAPNTINTNTMGVVEQNVTKKTNIPLRNWGGFNELFITNKYNQEAEPDDFIESVIEETDIDNFQPNISF